MPSKRHSAEQIVRKLREAEGYRPPAPEALLLNPAALRFAGLNNPLSAPSY